ncbi:MAG TPA: hypothetical protein VGW39_15555 [Chthoniobacterales bacterium]|nr:hypothetical protein [Chthoniobacterales bacterium]
MHHDPLFDSTENQALLVVCARKTIRNTGIAGIVWGVINLFIGYAAIQVTMLNAGLVVLALLMLGTGIVALTKPSLHALLAAAIVSTLLLFWNVGVTTLNLLAGDAGNASPGALIWPLIAAVIFFKQYLKLGHLKESIASMNHETVKEASGLCKQLFKSKLKESPDIAEASSRRCRMRFMSDAVFCAQRNLARAFYMNRTNFQECIPDLNRKKLRLVVRHPLGKLTYAFDKKNSEKIKGWLGAPAAAQSS